MEFSADSIAALTGGTVIGDGSVTVNTFAKIEEGHEGAISFLANPKYTHHIYTTRSSIVLVRRDFVPEHDITATLIAVDDPYATVASLLDMVSKMTAVQPTGIEQPSYVDNGVNVPEGAYIGAFAYIAKGVTLGRNVKIYPQVYIGENVSIGDDCIIYPGVKIYNGCRLGNRCVIHAGAVIGSDGFGFAPDKDGYKKIPQIGNVEIADDVEIGANTTVDRATMGSTRVGRGVKLDNLVQVAHNVEIGANTVMASQAGIAGSTKVGEWCMVGGQVGFAGHIKVGNRVSVGAQSGVPSDVGDGSRIMGYPAVDVRDFRRQAVYMKHLGELNRQVRDIEKKINGK